MKPSTNKPPELSPGNDFGTAIIHINGASIKVDADRSVVVQTQGNVKVFTTGDIEAHTSEGSITAYSKGGVVLKSPVPEQTNAIAELPRKAPDIGEKMKDGTIYAGISPDTGEAMFVTPQDAPLRMQWEAAMKYAAKLTANGHKDWSLPTKNELKELYNNCAKIGNFGGSYYWSSTEGECTTNSAWYQYFYDGYQSYDSKTYFNDVRCVRREQLFDPSIP